MGQTMGCAECHDHKFDPSTTHDFYALEAFFADVEEAAVGGRGPGMPVLTDEEQAKVKQFEAQAVELRKVLDASTPELAATQAEWEKQRRESSGQWKTVDFATLAAANGTMLTKQPDGSIKAGGTIPAAETYTLTANVDLKGITAIRLEALTDDAFKEKGPGTSGNGNFVLTEFKLAADGQPVKLRNAAADFSQDKFPVANAIDGKDDSGWAVMGAIGSPHVATFETGVPIGKDAPGPVTLTVTLEHKPKFEKHNLGRFRISATTLEKTAALQPLPVAVQAVVDADPAKRTDAQKNELAAYYRSVAPSLQPKRDELAKVEKSKNDLIAAAPKVLATVALKEPRTIRVLPRGNWLDDSGPIVEPAVPAFLGKLEVTGRRANRLDLAQWLVRKDNPLTSRVFMNRVWKLLLGRGLTQPLDDLGLQGELPANPELLDYLSADFIDNGWDVKRAIRNIVLSGTYRQSSRATAEQHEIDPFNKLSGRQGRFRLDAEFVRDNALAISGLLVDKIGGPSVKPYQPAGYWFALNFPPREWENDKGEGLYRRGLYTWWQRSFLHPSLLAFDAPTREECTAERPRSNIPQQALALLNDPTYVEAARVLAEKIVRQGGADTTARLQWAFGRALSREANPEELKVLTELFQKHSQTYAKDVDAATKLVSNGAAPVAKDLNVSELAAWTSVARAILNLHETITRY
jgi:hypothetical protein